MKIVKQKGFGFLEDPPPKKVLALKKRTPPPNDEKMVLSHLGNEKRTYQGHLLHDCQVELINIREKLIQVLGTNGSWKNSPGCPITEVHQAIANLHNADTILFQQTHRGGSK